MVALIDDADLERVKAEGSWYASPGGRTFYAYHKYHHGGVQRSILMHTFLTGWKCVDHANGNGLDNRRENLRLADASLNAMNRGLPSNNTSGYKGVTRNGNRWIAQIHPGRHLHLGTFATPQEAARAYDAAAIHHFGEFARPNFPQETK
jgi:hypothetical protein